MYPSLRTIFLILLLLLPAAGLYAQPGANPSPKGYGQTLLTEDRFTAAERHLIRVFFARADRQQAVASKNLPPGLQKNLQRGKPLPPGWQKKVAPGHSLDYRIYRQGTALPAALRNQLAASPAGVETIRVVDLVIRLNAATRRVIDSFRLAGTK